MVSLSSLEKWGPLKADIHSKTKRPLYAQLFRLKQGFELCSENKWREDTTV